MIYNANTRAINICLTSRSSQDPSSPCCQVKLVLAWDVVNSINMSQATMPQDILTKYKDVFEGLGCLPGEYHLEVDPSCRPVKHTPRRVAIPLKVEHTLRN